MARLRKTGPLLLALLAAAAAGEASASGGGTVRAGEAAACLDCHSRRGTRVRFQDGDSAEAHVDGALLEASVHRSLACSDCHPGFSRDLHPRRSFRSRAQYRTRAALACRRCHGDEQIRRRPIHAALLAEEREGRPTVCTNCHGSHGVAPVTRKRAFDGEEEYCLECHGHDVRMAFRDGEAVSVLVDRAALGASVHRKLACSDCHYGFSPAEHPRRHFASRRAYSIASSESCRRCHFDKYARTSESIHHSILTRGNLAAPVCVDCHGSHGVSHIAKERAATASRCRGCHQAVYDTYAQSVHGNALFSEHNTDVPVCVDCHTAHAIQDPSTSDYRQRIPEICSSCHANAAIVGKYGLSTAVLETYLSDFHGVTLGLYRIEKRRGQEGRYQPARPMAVCTDCHGTHAITRVTAPGASTIKANLAKTCRRCHEDAPADFPDAWLSHYEPTWATAPLVFSVGLVFRILLPVTVAGLVLQVLLHLWRYVANR